MSEGGPAMIELNGVSLLYPNGVLALDDVNLTLGKGEFAFLIGPSGAGKTSLMRLVFRDLSPSAGDVVVDGRNVNRLSASSVPYLRRSIGVVFQDFKLLNDRTVHDNVAFALHCMGVTGGTVKSHVSRALDAVGLLHRKHAHPLELSGGERQRVCIARAIVNDPVILLTDEPTGNLDPDIAREILKLLLDIHGRGTTVLMATHNQELVNSLRRRTITLRDGRVARDEARGGYALE